jgi:hypothetical protein
VVVAVVAALGGLAFVLNDDSDTSESSGGGARSGGGQAETGQEDAGGADIDEFADTLAVATPAGPHAW